MSLALFERIHLSVLIFPRFVSDGDDDDNDNDDDDSQDYAFSISEWKYGYQWDRLSEI